MLVPKTGPQCFAYLTDVVALLDQASKALACPAAPSAFLLEYLSPPATSGSPITYPRLCGLKQYDACACAIADVVMAHLLRSWTSHVDDATLMSAIKDLAMAITFQSGKRGRSPVMGSKGGEGGYKSNRRRGAVAVD